MYIIHKINVFILHVVCCILCITSIPYPFCRSLPPTHIVCCWSCFCALLNNSSAHTVLVRVFVLYIVCMCVCFQCASVVSYDFVLHTHTHTHTHSVCYWRPFALSTAPQLWPVFVSTWLPRGREKTSQTSPHRRATGGSMWTPRSLWNSSMVRNSVLV